MTNAQSKFAKIITHTPLGRTLQRCHGQGYIGKAGMCYNEADVANFDGLFYVAQQQLGMGDPTSIKNAKAVRQKAYECLLTQRNSGDVLAFKERSRVSKWVLAREIENNE